ncbi:MAG: hypothetical protein IKK32_03955 [Oscillospiraceae bacterium]|nr:hypothetical protein [Oscillospiraceae bacterium]MBR4093004.1 hypothetical protein [Oscillospiraceae bacterium]
MEYYTPEAIEKYKGREQAIKRRNKGLIQAICILIGAFIFMQTPLYELMVVSFRWGRPMVYKEHIRSGAIWDLRPRKYVSFSAVALGDDWEFDDFEILKPNRPILTPFDIKDGYRSIYFKDKIAEKTKKLIKDDFSDAKVYVNCGSGVDQRRKHNLFTSTDTYIKECQFEITIYAPMNNITKDEAMDLLYKYSDYFEAIKGKKIRFLSIVFFENEEDYQKIDEGQLNDLFWEKRLVVWQSYDGDYHYNYHPDND